LSVTASLCATNTIQNDFEKHFLRDSKRKKVVGKCCGMKGSLVASLLKSSEKVVGFGGGSHEKVWWPRTSGGSVVMGFVDDGFV
jgi:hypothetical protein